ncbi:hypothetical protein C8J57DRAFT_1367162 [Mycena rebaudengoi]|nr:hypothetical protein C8J57DRAFT_1367162 [Mycena rebaudengoi]
MDPAEITAAMKNVFGDTPIETRAFPIGPNAPSRDRRPWSYNTDHIRKNPIEAAVFLSKSANDGASRYIQSTLLREEADKLFKLKKYKDASAKYVKAANTMIGREISFHGPFRLDKYENLDATWELVDMLACVNGSAESLTELREYKEALLWLGEVEVIVRNVQFRHTREQPSFEWFDFGLQMSEYYLERLRARVTSAKIFFILGNTGAGTHRKWSSITLLADMPKDLETAAIRKIRPQNPMGDPVFELRHPDPKLVAKLSVNDASLQVRGSWQKVVLQKNGGITSRMGSASFVYNGYLYVLGGEKYLSGPYYRDFWCLDLNAFDKWRPLPPYPVPTSVIPKVVGFSMVVGGDLAYLFTGGVRLDVFNLKTNTWSSIMTSFESSWPYAQNQVTDYAMQCVRKKIYVFGGTHFLSPVGCDLLMELDIETRRWKRLSGFAQPKTANYSRPGPRELAASWVGKDQNNIFFLYGIADRLAAKLHSQLHGAYTSYGHDDLWCWNIKAAQWAQKRLMGNTPSPRGEMACTYNAKLDKVIVFGGYSPTVISVFPDHNTPTAFSYYADTFMYGTDSDSDSQATASLCKEATWKQVLTRGFPTYRAQAHMVSDPATGKTFLFGGYVNSEYVPSRSEEESRSVDIEDEARTARVGPWQRCFNCGGSGPWKKCGGACKGQAFFCEPQCQRDGWKEHKLKHNCRK